MLLKYIKNVLFLTENNNNILIILKKKINSLFEYQYINR